MPLHYKGQDPLQSKQTGEDPGPILRGIDQKDGRKVEQK